MAQQRVFSATENGGQALALPRQLRVSDCVSRAVNPMKPPGHRRMPESFPRISELRELPGRDDAVLLLRQMSQLMVTSPFLVHTD